MTRHIRTPPIVIRGVAVRIGMESYSTHQNYRPTRNILIAKGRRSLLEDGEARTAYAVNKAIDAAEVAAL